MFISCAARASEARGKIIVFNQQWTGYGSDVSYRSRGAVEAANVGAIAALVRSVGPYGIQTVHTGSSTPAAVPSGCISAEDAMQLQRFQDRGQKPVVELMSMRSCRSFSDVCPNCAFGVVGLVGHYRGRDGRCCRRDCLLGGAANDARAWPATAKNHSIGVFRQ